MPDAHAERAGGGSPTGSFSTFGDGVCDWPIDKGAAPVEVRLGVADSGLWAGTAARRGLGIPACSPGLGVGFPVGPGQKALAVLDGQASTVAASIRRKATTLDLRPRRRHNADRCADYLLAKRPSARLAEPPVWLGKLAGSCPGLDDPGGSNVM